MEYRIRPARREELASLQAVELEAGQRFRQIESLDGLADDLSPLDELLAAAEKGYVWVAETAQRPLGGTEGGNHQRLIGFAYGTVIDGCFHLEELSVVPEAGRRGVGTALVRTVCDAAAAAGFPAVTLTTFRHVPWNAPFYAKLGFQVLPPQVLSPELARAFHDEASRGLPIDLRVVMRLDLDRSPAAK